MQKSEKKVLFISFVISIAIHTAILLIFYLINMKPSPPEKEKIITVSLDYPLTEEKPKISEEKKEIVSQKVITKPQVKQTPEKPIPEKPTTALEEKPKQTEIPQPNPQPQPQPQPQEPASQTQTKQQVAEKQTQKIDLSAGRQEQIKPPPKKDEDVDGYLKELIRYLNQQARERDLYPPIAKRLRIEGQVVVRVTINEDGTIDENSMMIVEGSGYNVLDKGALDILKKLQPLKKPPKRITVEIPIVFQIIYM